MSIETRSQLKDSEANTWRFIPKQRSLFSCFCAGAAAAFSLRAAATLYMQGRMILSLSTLLNSLRARVDAHYARTCVRIHILNLLSFLFSPEFRHTDCSHAHRQNCSQHADHAVEAITIAAEQNMMHLVKADDI